ncbi:glycosyltransferase [Weissella paramesenteroides]|uniref:glycosyltransferase n=1 Tax=Weissella paramesenteroides TaxID=1249 RepID=UPI003F1FF797
MNLINYVTIIVTYNRKDKLVKAIKSHLMQTLSPIKVVIIDNASTDGTYELFQPLGFFSKEKRVEYFKLESNIGGSGGFQIALEKALKVDCDWILFGDDDAYFSSDYVETLTNKYFTVTNKEKLGVLTGTIKKFNTDTVEVGARSKIRNAKYIFLSHLSNYEYEFDTNIDVFTFVGPLIKKKVIQQVGNIQSEYFIHYDDSEFALRIRDKGYQAINVSKAIVYHDSQSASTLPVRDWRLYYDTRNRIHMMLLHGETNNFFKQTISVLLVIKLFKEVLTRKRPSDYCYNSKAIIMGFKDAIFKKLGKNEKFQP